MAIQFESSIDVNGSVAIGTTNNVLFNYASTLCIVAGSGQAITLGGGPGNVNNNVYVGNGNLFIPNGNVGIGTFSPSTALEVDGAISTTTSDYVPGSTGSRLLLETSGSGNTHSYIQAQSSGGTSNAEDLALQLYGGNVGIGTSSPGEKLTVKGTDQYIAVEQTSYPWGGANTLGLRMGTNGVSGLLDWRRWTGTGTNHGTAVIAQVNLDGGYGLDFRVNNQLTNTPATTSRMFLSSSGEVGIGTTSPTQKLDIRDGELVFTQSSTNQNPSGRIRFNEYGNSTVSGSYMEYNGASNYFSMFTNSETVNYEFLRAVRGSHLLLQPSSGNVGIGTTSPTYKLQVAGDGAFNSTLDVQDPAVSNNGLLQLSHASTGSSIYSNPGSSNGSTVVLRLGINYSEKMRIANNGNVGIGTTNPGEKLVVEGNTSISNNIYVGFGNTLKSCTYPATNSLAVGALNVLGGEANGIIGIGNTIECTNEPWLNLGGNFIAGLNNNIFGFYSHANAVFGQLNDLGTSSINNANTLISGSEHEVTSSNALVFGKQCRAFGAVYSLTGGYDSNNFGQFGSVAIGAGATASTGNNQYAFGSGVTTPTFPSAAYGADQFVVGKFNEYTNASSVPHRFAVGNGANDASRDTPFCVIGGGTYTNGQVSINDADGFAYSSVPYSVFHVNGRATSSYSSSFTFVSDERVKKNIVNYSKGLAEIIQVQPKSYTFNGKANTVEGVESIGVLAQEIKEVFPETVGTVAKKLNPEDEQETELYAVDISPVTYALINAVKELNAKVEALEARIQTLEGN